jgi:hypothetical protein
MVAIFFANIFKVQVVNAHACPQFLAIELELPIDNGEYTVGIFLDLSKAFDTSQDSGSDQLAHYGIQGITQLWFQDYLTNRNQITKSVQKRW